MEPTEEPVTGYEMKWDLPKSQPVIYTYPSEIEEVEQFSPNVFRFKLKNISTKFWVRGYESDLQVGQEVRITIEKVPNANPDHNNQT